MKLFLTLAVALQLSLPLFGNPSKDVFKAFRNPEDSYRPYVRWWWNGDRVYEAEIRRELNLLKEPDTLVGWGDLLSKFFITHEESEFIVRRKIRKVRFVSEEPVAWTKDGEFGGNLTEVEIEAEPYAVRIMRGKK